MAIRPGDSAPNFDRIEGRHTAPGHAAGSPPIPPGENDGLPDSHVFQMPVMVPHYSDGTTDVLQRGRAGDGVHDVAETTEPLFPRQTLAGQDPASGGNDDVTMELQRVTLARPASSDDEPTVAMQRPAELVAARAVEPIRPQSPVGSAAAATPVETSAGVGRSLLFLLLLSYASAVTIGLIYLLITRDPQALQRHQLEDLRDPVDESGTVRIYQRGVELPPGHTLALGESQRFGNIRVEPLRVTQGPVEFEHYSKNAKQKQPASPPVFKLWLRLTNVSSDQTITPLDALLMFKRELNRDGELVSNTFVAPRGQAAAGPVVFAYPAAQDSEWDMRGQQLGRTLAPGESLETFIPSDAEGLESLVDADALDWRFHLRKGYAPSGRGLTTLVQVRFAAADVQPEQSTKSPEVGTDSVEDKAPRRNRDQPTGGAARAPREPDSTVPVLRLTTGALQLATVVSPSA